MRDLIRSPRITRRSGLRALCIALFAAMLAVVPVAAAGPVQDDGNMFSANARSSAESKINQLQRDTGKTIAVKSVTNLGGKDVSSSADQYFQQQKLNGVLLYFAKDDKKFAIKVGTDTRQAISQSEETAINTQITDRFRANDFDGGLLNAVDRLGTDLRAAAPARSGSQPAAAPAAAQKSSSGFPVILIVLLVLAVVAVVVILLMRRNRSNTGASGGGYNSSGQGGQSGYGSGGYGPQGGYGPNYGQPSGGGGNVAGSIIGGAAAGIGGAIVGNAIYDHFRDHDDNQSGDRASVGDYGASGDDQGRVDDSSQDVGGWDSGGDSSTGDWGGGDSSGGDSGGSSDSSD